MKGRVPAVRDTGQMQMWFVDDVPLGPIGLCILHDNAAGLYGAAD